MVDQAPGSAYAATVGRIQRSGLSFARVWRYVSASVILALGFALAQPPETLAQTGGYRLDGTLRGVQGGLAPDAWREIGGLAMAPDGVLFVSDAGDGRITVLGPDETVRTLVEPGAGLVTPTHLALDAHRGRLFVSDPGAGALVVLDTLTGEVLRRHEGISGPTGVGVGSDGTAFVAAADTGQVHVFGPEGEIRGQWSAAPDDDRPGIGDLLRGLDVDADNIVYVVDGRRERLTLFNTAGARQSSLSLPRMGIDVAVEYDRSLGGRKRFWVVTATGLARYDPRTKAWDQILGRPPLAIALRMGVGSALAYRAEPGQLARVEFRPHGTLGGSPTRSWGKPVLVPGALNGPLGIAVSSDGRLLVMDLDPHVQRFDPDGEFVDLISTGDVVDLAGASDGRFFVLSPTLLRAYGPDRTPAWARTIVGRAVALAFDPSTDSLAVMDAGGRLGRYRSADGGDLVQVTLDAPSENLPDWVDLAADPSGTLFALERRSAVVARIAIDDQVSRFPVATGARRLTAAADGATLTLGRDGWVRRYGPDGRPAGAFDAVRFDLVTASDPVDLAADAGGRVYVADRKANFISRYGWDPQATATTAPDETSGCRHYADKVASPGHIWLGETVDVRLTVRGGCGSLARAEPLDIVLVIDESGSMTGEKIRTARDAARDFVTELDLSLSRVAVVGFDTTARNYLSLTHDQDRIYRAIERLAANGGTRIDLGLREARNEITLRGRFPMARPIFVLLSDGYNNAGPDPVLREAIAAKASGVEIYTIGIQADAVLMAAVASSPEHHFAPRSARFLYEVFEAIAQRISTTTLFRRLVVTDLIPANMRYIPGSAEPPADFDPQTNTLIWRLDNVPFRGFGLGYRLQPLEIGTWPTNVVAWGEGTDGFDRPARVDFPIPEIVVLGPTATPTATASATPTPSPTATRRPAPIYLPLAVSEACSPTQLRADVVLVLDASSSMTGEKLLAAKSAAKLFVDLVVPPSVAEGGVDGPQNQVAVVGFNASAWLAHALSTDRAGIHAALDGLTVREGTRIDHGLNVALTELWGPRHIANHTPTLILLTDGLQNGPTAPVLELSTTALTRGTLIFTIGLGEDVDAAFLAALAGTPTRRHLAPESGDLAAIYGQIAGEIPCMPGAFWAGRAGP